MYNLNIQCVFVNNLNFQLLNHFILPNSMLSMLINIYMSRYNKKTLSVTSSFVGWLIDQHLYDIIFLFDLRSDLCQNYYPCLLFRQNIVTHSY